MLALEETGKLHAAVLEHRALLEAVAFGKGEVAAQIMRDHVEHFETAMRRVLLSR